MKRLTTFLTISFLLSCSERSVPVEPPSDGGTGGSYTLLQGSVDGSLTISQSPFRVIRDVSVDSLKTLNIQPGVKVYFQDSTKFVVRGKLVCMGALSNPILFSAFSGTWKGVVISRSSEVSYFQFAIVENVDVSVDVDRNGAVEVVNSSVTITNSIFRNNKANNGGAISLDRSQSLVTNCLFVNNYSTTFGGALLSSQSSDRIINNTFFKNASLNYGGGLVLATPVLDEVQNNIFFMNANRSGDPRIAYYQADSSHYVSQFNFLAFGTLDPLLVSAADMHLTSGSPCINTGNPSSQFNDVDGTRNDQGAYGGPLGNW